MVKADCVVMNSESKNMFLTEHKEGIDWNACKSTQLYLQ